MSKHLNRRRSGREQSSNRRTQSTMASKNSSHGGTGKGQKLLSGTRDQLIKDLQRVHKVFPTAQPDRDFYRVHGKYTDAAIKVHFSRFKAIALVKKWHENAEYGEGWVKHQIDAVNARVHELDELFYIWRLINEMDEEEAAAVKPEPEPKPADYPLVKLGMPKELK